MRSGPPLKIAIALALSGLVLPATAALAAEHITLANGFEMVCDHHMLVAGRVRLYAQASAGDYVELSPESIRAVETVPDPPPDPAETDQAGSLPSAPATVGPAATRKPAETESRLTDADLRQLLSRAGSEHNVDADLLASLVKAESNGNAQAVSRTGARGLMQLMPGTAREMGVADSFVPAENVRGGTAYFDALLTRYHDNIALALAAYNAGPEAVDRYHGIPPYHETRVYVARVIHEFNRRVAARRATSGALSTASRPLGGQ